MAWRICFYLNNFLLRHPTVELKSSFCIGYGTRASMRNYEKLDGNGGSQVPKYNKEPLVSLFYLFFPFFLRVYI